MLKRLLVAVFALGLFMAFSGTAISGPIGNDETQRIAVPTGNPAKSTVILDHSTSHPPQNQRVPVAQPAPGADYATPADIDTAGCATPDYTHFTGCGFYAWWTTSALGAAEQQFSMRFDISPSHSVNVNAARVRVYAKTGAASLVVSVYSDNSGIPGGLLYSQGFVPLVGNNLYTFATPVNITTGGPYHIGIAVAGGPLDSVRLGSDDGVAGTGRGSVSLAGVWYPNSSIVFGVGCGGPLTDPNWRIVSNVCQYYVKCAMIIPDPRGYYSDGLPDNAWTDGSVLSGTGQRFKAEGPETLKFIRFRHTASSPTYYTGTSTNSLAIKIWGDSSGYARLTPGPILSFTYPAGLANLFPVGGNVPPTIVEAVNMAVPGTPVMLGYYHITVEMASLNPADGRLRFRFGQPGGPGGGMVKFTPPGSGREWDNIAGNLNMINEFYGGLYDGTHSCDIRPTTCKSEFSECKYGTATSCGVATRIQQASMIPPGGCGVSYYHAWANRIKGNPVNNIDKIRVNVVADFNSGTCISTPTATLQICVWQSVGNAPGPLIAAYPVTPIVSDPGWNEVVIPGGLEVLGDFFIGYNIDLFVANEFIWATYQRNGDAGPCPPIRDGAWVLTKGLGTPPAGLTDNTWYNRLATFGVQDNIVAEVDYCSIPLDERPCVTENDWPTFQHDFTRSGASGIALDDAYCDLTLAWSAIRPTGRGILFSGPIIWNNYVICAFSSATAASYEVFNLATGGPAVESIDDATWFGDQSVIGGNIRCTPTVATVDIDPTAAVNLRPVLFISGGNPGSISAFNLSAGFPLAFPASKLWTFSDVGNIGTTRYGNLIVLNIGGTDVVYVAADDNKVYAINATTGLSYGPWATPYTLSYSSQKSGASDGTRLFYSLFNTSGNGKITAINANNGTMAWDFTLLQGSTIHPGTTAETFEAGVSVDVANLELFANSRELDGEFQGVFYRLNPLTGALISAAASERARLTTPTIDAKHIYVPTIPAFVFSGMPYGGNLIGISRLDGTIDYAAAGFESHMTANTQSGFRVEGVLTCEPDSSDLFYVFSTSGYLSCFRADNGDEIYSRRVDHGISSPGLGNPAPSEGGMGAIGKDNLGRANLVFVDAYGGLYAMRKGAPRARLELLAGTRSVAVPFGSPADTVVEFPDMYTNTGCVNLVVTLTASTTSNGTSNPVPGYNSIGSRLDQSASTLADMLASNPLKLSISNGKKYLSRDEFNGSVDEVVTFADSRETYNRSAAAVPAFLVDAGGGDVFDPTGGGLILLPGDTAGIRVHANGPLVNRGPNSFYVEYSIHNDPDYYLDVPTRKPEVFLSLVGGCLADTTHLTFGAGSANLRLVTNTSMLGKADFNPPTYGFKIDGMIDILFAGTVAYGVSNHSLALHANAWDGSANEWISSQADPNTCDLSCKPDITSSVALGEITTNGIAYVPITGRVVCKSMIDSVQNFDPGSGWDWSNFGAPFDNALTMGLSVNARAIGVVNAPPAAVLLNNMTLDIWDITNRSAVNSVLNWKIGAYNDNDIRAIHGGAYDTTIFDASRSVGWATSITGVAAAGFVKIPFGCGYSGMKNIVSAVADEWVYIPDWDTAYHYMNKPAGSYDQGVFTSPQDEGSWFTLAEHDFAPSGTYSLGYAFFAFDGLANAFSSTADGKIANLATLVNQWAGFGRGDVNNDGVINLADVVYLAAHVNFAGPGAIPFKHLGDANASGGAPTAADIQVLVDYYFNYGPCPSGAFVL